MVVVAATNRPDMLDPALLRPGRFDRKIYVCPPDAESRRQIISSELCKLPTAQNLSPSEVIISELVQLTDGFSGAEVVSVFSEAAMLAVDRDEQDLRKEHLITAIKNTVPQITPDMLDFYASIAKSFSQ